MLKCYPKHAKVLLCRLAHNGNQVWVLVWFYLDYFRFNLRSCWGWGTTPLTFPHPTGPIMTLCMIIVAWEWAAAVPLSSSNLVSWERQIITPLKWAQAFNSHTLQVAAPKTLIGRGLLLLHSLQPSQAKSSPTPRPCQSRPPTTPHSH